MANLEQRLKRYKMVLSWSASGKWHAPSGHQCENGLVYILHCEGIYKIGCTKSEQSLVGRMNDARRKYGRTFTLFHTLTSNCKLAAEAYVHGSLIKYRAIAQCGDRLGIELFLLPDEKASELLLISGMNFDAANSYGDIVVEHSVREI